MAETKEEVKADIKMHEKRQFLTTIGPQISRDARRAILQWAVLNLPDETIREKPDGVRIYLNNISDERAQQLWSYVNHLLKT